MFSRATRLFQKQIDFGQLTDSCDPGRFRPNLIISRQKEEEVFDLQERRPGLEREKDRTNCLQYPSNPVTRNNGQREILRRTERRRKERGTWPPSFALRRVHKGPYPILRIDPIIRVLVDLTWKWVFSLGNRPRTKGEGAYLLDEIFNEMIPMSERRRWRLSDFLYSVLLRVWLPNPITLR